MCKMNPPHYSWLRYRFYTFCIWGKILRKKCQKVLKTEQPLLKLSRKHKRLVYYLYTSIHSFIHLSIHPLVHPFIHPSTHLSIYLYLPLHHYPKSGVGEHQRRGRKVKRKVPLYALRSAGNKRCLMHVKRRGGGCVP